MTSNVLRQDRLKEIQRWTVMGALVRLLNSMISKPVAGALFILVLALTTYAPKSPKSLTNAPPASESFALDFNHDNQLDLLVVGLQPGVATALQLFENLGDLRFQDVTAEKLGDVRLKHPRHLATGDFDGDGKMDFVLADHGFDSPPFAGGQPVLLMSRAGRLVDESNLRLPSGLNGFTFHVAVLDVNEDGSADIYLSNIPGPNAPAQILINDGRGLFTLREVHLKHPEYGLDLRMMSAAVADLDRDGKMDLILGAQDLPVAGAAQARDLILNFVEGLPQLWASTTLPLRLKNPAWGTVSLLTEDLNGDGWTDIVAATHDYRFKKAAVQIYRNLGGRRFKSQEIEIAQDVGTKGFVAWVQAGDSNGDGWKDLIFSVRDTSARRTLEPIHLFHGGPDFTFTRASHTLPTTVRRGSNLIHLIDADGDGHSEIVQVGYDRKIQVYKTR